jgi:hypothetical protein
MANTYYSGQGSLYLATRNATTGKPEGFLPIGNVPELTLDIETSNFEHKESETGSRLLDVVIIKEKKGKFNFKLENLNLDNLALGLWGETATVAGGTVAAGSPEVITIPMDGDGRRYPLAHPNVSSVVVKDATDTTTYTVTTDYTVDAVNGVIVPTTTGALAAVVEAAPADIHVSYAYAGYKKVDAFTQANAPERWLRFEGINTVDGNRVIVDIFRAQFDPLTGYGLLNEDLGSVDMKGTVLADTLQVGASKFFRQVNT